METDNPGSSPKEWESLEMISKIFGIPRDVIASDIQGGRIPFRKNGSHYKVNIELARESYKKMDLENMAQVKRLINAMPMSESKVTKGLGSYRPNPNIRRVEV